MPRYIPMPAYPDRMPIDISFAFGDEKPAGKHGFCKAVGDDLRFEDGTPVRFWGVNFNGGANFPEHDYARKVARRLSMAGVNIVRFHQLDAEWNTPNIFSFCKGKRITSTRQLDPESMDRLDYLIYCLKEQGIYCYLDLLTYRKFKEADDVPQHDLLNDKARPWSGFDPRLIELQKEYCTQLWTHYNPYTKLEYRNDPVFVLAEIVNESDLFVDSHSKKVDYVEPDYYVREFRRFFKDWLEERGIHYDWENCGLYAKDEPLIEFKLWLSKRYYREMHDFLRSIGVKIPIAGTNWTKNMDNVHAHEEMDFTDSHHYYYDWRWGNVDRICKNASITSSPYVFPNMPRMRLAGKPFFVSEWDMPWPNSYRAEGPIYYAAVGALQNWSGFTIHTYSYCSELYRDSILGREQSTPVGGVPYREGIFSTWNDPAKFGLFYHAALMLRRRDITPATKKVAVYATGEGKEHTTLWRSVLEKHQAATTVDGSLPEGYDEVKLPTDTIPNEIPHMLVSDNKQMWRDLKKEVGAIDTPRTKVVYGQLGRGAGGMSVMKKTNVGIQLEDLGVTCTTDFGVIAMSSLTDDPIHQSDNILLSAIGRARNTDMMFDGEKMLDVGRAPIMAEVIEADIALRTNHGDKLKVWGVNAEGFYAGKLPTRYEDGVLHFHIGDAQNPACYYLIVKE